MGATVACPAANGVVDLESGGVRRHGNKFRYSSML